MAGALGISRIRPYKVDATLFGRLGAFRLQLASLAGVKQLPGAKAFIPVTPAECRK